MPDEASRDRRARKKAQTARDIRRIAQRLFAERGFEAVTVADIAAVAGVAVQTVFNHFTSKEDLFFAGRVDWVEGAARAVADRRPGTGAIATAEAWMTDGVLAVPAAMANPDLRRYVEVLQASPTLRVRQRELLHLAARNLGTALHRTWVDQLGDLPGLRVPADLVSGVLMSSARVLILEQRRVASPDGPSQLDQDELAAFTRLAMAGVAVAVERAAASPESPAVLRRVAELERGLPADLTVVGRRDRGDQLPAGATTGSRTVSTSSTTSSSDIGTANAV